MNVFKIDMYNQRAFSLVNINVLMEVSLQQASSFKFRQWDVMLLWLISGTSNFLDFFFKCKFAIPDPIIFCSCRVYIAIARSWVKEFYLVSDVMLNL